MTRKPRRRREDPSITDVAARAGVSIATVSRIINGVQKKASPATAEKVRNAVLEFGYRPSSAGRALRQGRSRTVGLLAANLANPAMAAIIASTEVALREAGLVMLIADTHEQPSLQDEYLKEMRAQRVRSTVLLAAVASPGLADAMTNGEPLFFVNRRSPIDRQAPFVGIDNGRAAREVAAFLIGQGRQHLAVIHGSLDSSATSQRVLAFKAYMERHRKSGPALRVGLAPGLDHLEIGYRALADLVRDHKRIDGIFCTSDLIAFGAHRYAEEHGIAVPEDIFLVGFDDSPLNDWIAPWLSSVRVPYSDFGRAIASQITAATGEHEGAQTLLRHTLINRIKNANPA